MKALIDGDILRYEIGFAAETGWRHKTGDENATPPFDYVRDMLNQRIGYIKGVCRAWDHDIYITEGRTFRFDIGKTKEYKGQRGDNKPFHFANLTVYLRDLANAKVITDIEADDAMAIDHVRNMNEEEHETWQPTIICSRDKDLRQVPGPSFSWELGKQPSFGPADVTKLGWLDLNTDKKPPKLTGTGYKFFASQVLTGDTADNIPGLPKYGVVKAHALLADLETCEEIEQVLIDEYKRVYGEEGWEQNLTEQAQLCWIVRRLNEDGTPEIWRQGLYE